MPRKQVDLKPLVAKKNALFQRVERIMALAERFPDKDAVEEFRERIISLDATKENFERTMDDINVIKSLENQECDFAEVEKFNELYCKIKRLERKIAGGVCEEKSISCPTRLPKLELPQFDGELRNWPVFWETFNRVIHQNPNLSADQKVQYLVGRLTGKAFGSIASIPVTGSNYEIIWSRLTEKYQDEFKLAKFYFAEMMSFRPLSYESADALEKFLEKFVTAYEALKNLKLPNLADFIVLQLAATKIDTQTFRNFEMSVRDEKSPDFQQLTKFISQQIKILDRPQNLSLGKRMPAKPIDKSHAFVINESKIKKCPCCAKASSHHLFLCDKFKTLSVQDRFNFVKAQKSCFNCLSFMHNSIDCKSKVSCSKCKRRHHTLLHFENQNSENKVDEKLVEAPITLYNQNQVAKGNQETVLLSTAIATCDSNRSESMRILLDSASQSNLVTDKCRRKLGLPLRKCGTSLQGIGNSTERVLGKTVLKFSSRFEPEQKYTVEALVVDQISGKLPSIKVDQAVKRSLGNFRLADSTFDIPGAIDALIGAELYPQLIKEAKCMVPHSACHLIDTTLGFVVMGRVSAIGTDDKPHNFHIRSENLEPLMRKFWEIETFDENMPPSEDEANCEDLFVKGVTRTSEGRYMVKLPFSEHPMALGESFKLAKSRFLNLETKLNKDTTLKEQYKGVIREFVDKNYLTEVNCDTEPLGYFIPHHGVYKKESASTPLRIVFDASAKTTSGKSLNDILHTGAKLQADPVKVLLNFRLFAIAMTADIKKMYMQILLHPDCRKFQRIVWRDDSESPLKIFEINRVAFGLRSSPFLALRVIRKLVEDEKVNYPLAHEYVLRDMYVDDVVISVDNLDLAFKLYQELQLLFSAGGFELSKWRTNSEELFQKMRENTNLDCTQNAQSLNISGTQKVLGLRWNPADDRFSFHFDFNADVATKRNILSTIARMFDPLGLIAPVILVAKILIKTLWQEKLGWDDRPSEKTQKTWCRFLKELELINRIRIPRHVFASESTAVELLGFCDGSTLGYGAVVYVRIPSDGAQGVRSNLLCSKCRVTPIKELTIPRIELCAALLLAKLLRFVTQCLGSRVELRRIWAFSDSQIVLHWLNASPSRWQPFVANRVSKILENLAADNWYHVSSSDNPADLVSRGMWTSELVQNSFWWEGPSWIRQDCSTWPVSATLSANVEGNEFEIAKPIPRVLVIQEIKNPILNLVARVSSWSKLLRIMSYILKFGKKLTYFRNQITARELNVAEFFLIRVIQKTHFKDDIRLIKEKGMCTPQILKLHPFLSNGLLRVGGRLTHSNLSFEEKHPLLIPRNSPAANLIIDFYHRTYLHPGPNLLMSLIRQRFWIISLRRLVKTYISRCVSCFKVNPKLASPFMADLPEARVVGSQAFAHTGVDYAGPFSITLQRGRGQRSHKAYVALFVCMATKAVHLEVCSGLNTLIFLNAFKRFIARRGLCGTLYSDQGTNFQGAKNLLKELYAFLNSPEYLTEFGNLLAEKGVTWKFNPPGAPHFGGLWESMVKSFKRRLYRSIGAQVLCLEEFETVCAQIEAIMNSRPISALSEDPSEPPLTPAHFLVAKPLTAFPNTDLPTLAKLGRPQLVEQLVATFWKRWNHEYLQELQVRQKWNTPQRPITVGTAVLVADINLPPLQWSRGVVDQVFPAKDGHIRVAKVRTAKGVYTRPVVKLAPLPIA